MPASANFDESRPPVRSERVRRRSESPSFESTRIGLSRVRSQYFKRKFPQTSDAAQQSRPCARGRRKKFACALNHLRGAVRRTRLLLLQSVNEIVKRNFGGRLIDEVPIEFAAGLQCLHRHAGKADRGGELLRILRLVGIVHLAERALEQKVGGIVR